MESLKQIDEKFNKLDDYFKGFIDDIYLDEFINELFSLLSNEHFIKFLIL